MSRLWGGGVSRAYSIRMGGEVLSFTEAIKTCFQKYAEFRGRASRPEFWWFVLRASLLHGDPGAGRAVDSARFRVSS